MDPMSQTQLKDEYDPGREHAYGFHHLSVEQIIRMLRCRGLKPEEKQRLRNVRDRMLTEQGLTVKTYFVPQTPST